MPNFCSNSKRLIWKFDTCKIRSENFCPRVYKDVRRSIIHWFLCCWTSRLVAAITRPNYCDPLTHWGRVTHICVGNLTIIGPDNGLSPGRCQAIIWTNAGILLIEPLRTNFSEISIKSHAFSFKEMHLKMSSGKWRPSCLGLNVLTGWGPMS